MSRGNIPAACRHDQKKRGFEIIYMEKTDRWTDGRVDRWVSAAVLSEPAALLLLLHSDGP